MSLYRSARNAYNSYAGSSTRSTSGRPVSTSSVSVQPQGSGGTSRHVGGFNPPTQPPPGADPQLWSWFQSVDEDRLVLHPTYVEWLEVSLHLLTTLNAGAITADELQRALVNGNWTQFDLDTVRMLMGLFDTDRSGTIGFHEFVGLWKYIAEWQKVFRHFDQDQSGSIDGAELANALRQFGYNLSPQLLSLLEQKYASLPGGYGSPGGINFDRFVRACVSTKTLTEAFQRLDTDRDGWINLDYETFMRIVLSAP
ncbi:hypothetical protein FRC03_001855 [Tulasnella sp. 419]|nr:hypothetical protein FRC03_001855 [Tulasnella sp. 419]